MQIKEFMINTLLLRIRQYITQMTTYNKWPYAKLIRIKVNFRNEDDKADSSPPPTLRGSRMCARIPHTMHVKGLKDLCGKGWDIEKSTVKVQDNWFVPRNKIPKHISVVFPKVSYQQFWLLGNYFSFLSALMARITMHLWEKMLLMTTVVRKEQRTSEFAAEK